MTSRTGSRLASESPFKARGLQFFQEKSTLVDSSDFGKGFLGGNLRSVIKAHLRDISVLISTARTTK
jgi:hypothetical protein